MPAAAATITPPKRIAGKPTLESRGAAHEDGGAGLSEQGVEAVEQQAALAGGLGVAAVGLDVADRVAQPVEAALLDGDSDAVGVGLGDGGDAGALVEAADQFGGCRCRCRRTGGHGGCTTHPEFVGTTFSAHDFRRIFATDLVNSGLPIHICAALLGHLNIQTTRGYVAVFDDDIVRHYQQFLDQRRQLRPEEYRDPTSEEWSEFQEHFDKRKVELAPWVLGVVATSQFRGCDGLRDP